MKLLHKITIVKSSLSHKVKDTGELPPRILVTVWIMLGVVFLVSLLNLVGWILNFPVLKSINPAWIPMEVQAAICFILSGVVLIVIQSSSGGPVRSWLIRLPVAVIILMSLVTLMNYSFGRVAGYEASMQGPIVLKSLLNSLSGMLLLSAIIFLVIGLILLLLSLNNDVADSIAHVLIFPISLASYFILVSYVFNLHEVIGLIDDPVSLNSGIAFSALCSAIMLIRPDTWLMKVFTNKNVGGIMARRLLPALILMPVIIGWLRIHGENSGFFSSELGVLLVVIAYTTFSVLLIWQTGRVITLIDDKRYVNEQAILKSREELEKKVQERTADLSVLNTTLQRAYTELERAEKAVEAERQRLNQVLDLMPAYLILLTPDYKVIYSNRFFRERFGESFGKNCNEYLFDRSKPVEVFDTFVALNENRPHRWEWTGPDGRDYSIFDFPYTDTDGSKLIMEAGIDITELKKAEVDLKNLNAILEQRIAERTIDLEKTNKRLNEELAERKIVQEALKENEIQLRKLIETKDKFFNIVAHDLKNPFTSLLGSSELMVENINQLKIEEIRELAKILNESAKWGYATLLNLLDWSRSQTGLMIFKPERLNVKDIIDENISGLRLSAVNKEIDLESVVEDGIFIFADRNMLHIIMRNLLSNAIKFTQRGGKVSIKATLTVDAVIISVTDTGTGILPEVLDKLFRIDTSFQLPGTEMEQGTGLGLKLSKEFVEKHGGKIWVESIVAEGSTFQFSIPYTSVPGHTQVEVTE